MAARIEDISVDVVLPKGSSVIHKSLVIEFSLFGAHFHRAATRAIVILRCVHQPTGLEIGKEREGAPVQTVDGRVENLVEVMRQNLGTEAYGYTSTPG